MPIPEDQMSSFANELANQTGVPADFLLEHRLLSDPPHIIRNEVLVAEICDVSKFSTNEVGIPLKSILPDIASETDGQT